MGATSRRRLLWVAGAAVLAVAALVLLRARSSQAAADVTSGTPGPDRTGSAAQQPSGGASSVPGQLPSSLLVSSDPVQQGVQTTDASSMQAPTMSSSSSYPQFTTTTAPGGQTFTTDVGGATSNPSNPATYNPVTGSWFEGALPAPVSSPDAGAGPNNIPAGSPYTVHQLTSVL